MTLTDLILASRTLMAETSATAGYATDAEITSWINEAIDRICIDGEAYETVIDISVTNGQTFYDLPPNFIKVVALLNHLNESLEEIVPALSGKVYIVPGKPLYFYIFQAPSYESNTYVLGLVDTPTTSGGGVGQYTLIYKGLAPHLYAMGHTPAFPLEYHRLIPSFVCFRWSEKHKDLTLAQFFFSEYARGIGLEVPQSSE